MWILFLSLEHAMSIYQMKHTLYETKESCEVAAKALVDFYGPPLKAFCSKEYDV